MRALTPIRGRAAWGWCSEIAPRSSEQPSWPSVIPSAWASRPGPLAIACAGACGERPRSSRMRSIPRAGSMARSSTAAALPRASQTTLAQVWIP
jgi:hypothetical protein